MRGAASNAIAAVILVCVMVLCGLWGASKAPKQPSDPDVSTSPADVPASGKDTYNYVIDGAGVLSADTAAYIDARNAALRAACDGEILVATVRTLGETDISEYAQKLGNQYDIGSSRLLNGLVLVLAIDDGSAVAVQGDGLLSALTNDQITEIMNDELYDDFMDGRYDEGVRKVFDRFVEWYEDY